VAEAEENARAGSAPVAVAEARPAALVGAIDAMKASVCSRCGHCDDLCSQRLPVSWLFRDAYITHYPSETFETVDRLRYFHLHPRDAAACATCADVTCACPHGIDIPRSLMGVHAQMLARRAEGLLPEPPAPLGARTTSEPFAAATVTREIPPSLRAGETAIGRLYVQNVGSQTWKAPASKDGREGVRLDASLGGRRTRTVLLRHDA
jgi:ferredoxin